MKLLIVMLIFSEQFFFTCNCTRTFDVETDVLESNDFNHFRLS